MAGKLAVKGEQFQPLFLGLDKQQFVERIPVTERRLERPRGMQDRHRQERHVLFLERGDRVIRIETALARAGRMPGMEFEPHLPDRYGADKQLRFECAEKTEMRRQHLPRPVHKVVEIGRVEQHPHRRSG